MPVYANGELVAVVGSDLFLNSMNEAIQSSESNGGFECVINSAGHVILSPKESGIFRAVESANATDLRTNSNSELATMVVDAMKGNTGVRLVHMDGGTYYMAGSPIGTLGWTLLYIFDQAMADKPAEMLTSSYQSIQEEAGSTYLAKMAKIRTMMRVLYFAVVILALASAIILGKKIVRPLNLITKRIAGLSETNLEFTMEDEYRTDERNLLPNCPTGRWNTWAKSGASPRRRRGSARSCTWPTRFRRVCCPASFRRFRSAASLTSTP